jgi:four helix bundle protein
VLQILQWPPREDGLSSTFAWRRVCTIVGRMWARRLEDLIAFQLAVEFKREVYRLVKAHPAADRDFRYRDQIRNAAAGVERSLTEGFHRNRDPEFLQFIRYALASLAEARGHVRDGVDRDYFNPRECRQAASLGRRCEEVTAALYRNIEQSIERRKQERRRRKNGRASAS